MQFQLITFYLTATSSLNHFPFKHFAINSWVVSFHVFFTSFHSNRHSFLNQSVGGAFMELKGTMLTGSKLKSNNKYWRGCECYCRTSSLNLHRFHNKTVFLPPWTVLMYKCVYIARVCVCLREGYCNRITVQWRYSFVITCAAFKLDSPWRRKGCV